MSGWAEKLRSLKQNTYALWLASSDPRVPWLARVIILIAVAYAISPIDLIPDFIPVLGYLDDLLILPLAIYLAIRLIPDPVWQQYKNQAAAQIENSNLATKATLVIVLIWLIVLTLLGIWLYQIYQS